MKLRLRVMACIGGAFVAIIVALSGYDILRTYHTTVENTGARLTPQLSATLVEPFQRVSRRIRNDHAGVGLGLAIVKSITEAHGGTLTLTPRPAGGLSVTVQLPPAGG